MKRVLVALLAALIVPAAQADEALWAKLKAGGNVVLVRHASTEGGQGDPPGFRLGDCATQRNLPYAGYTDLAQKPEVYALIRDCVEKVNADLAQDELLAGSQMSRFLILHKELDADDGELTRTRKVRRGFIGERYAVLVDALYGGKSNQYVETQVKFEDGRTGMVAADLRIEDAKVFPATRKAA